MKITIAGISYESLANAVLLTEGAIRVEIPIEQKG